MLTTFYGYGVRYNGLKYLTDDKKIKYLSTEANMKRYEGKEKEDYVFGHEHIYNEWVQRKKYGYRQKKNFFFL